MYKLEWNTNGTPNRANRFHPQENWVPEVISWDKAGYQPKDGSWGYIEIDGQKKHVMAHDWIIDNPIGKTVVSDATFREKYKELPLSLDDRAMLDERYRVVETENTQEPKRPENKTPKIKYMEIRIEEDAYWSWITIVTNGKPLTPEVVGILLGRARPVYETDDNKEDS